MASQVKKNKNQFLRKGVTTSSVRNTLQDANIVDVSTIQSGVERIQIETTYVNSGVQSGVERVPTDTPISNSGVWSGTKTNIPNVNSGEINVSLRSTQQCAEGVNNDSISGSAVNKFAGQQTYDHSNNAPPLPQNPPPELPPQPPRTVKYKTFGQHSSPANRGVNHRSPTLKKKHSSRRQMEFSPQVAHNLDNDGEENEVLFWEYPGERSLMGQQRMASEIQYPNFKEHSQMHYGEEGILGDIEQGIQSSEAGHMLDGQYGEQSGQILSGHHGGPMQQMQGLLNMGNIGNMHPSGREFGYTPSWQEDRCSGQFQDGQHGKRFLMHTMEHVTTRHLKGAMEPGPNIHHAGTMGPGPTRHHAGTMEPGPNIHHAGTMGLGPFGQRAGAMGPAPNMHHVRTMGPGPNMHHAGTMGPGPNMHHAGTMGPEHTRHDAGAMVPGLNIHNAGTMGPGQNMHHAGTMGPRPNMHHAGIMGLGPTSHYAGAMVPGLNIHNAGTMGPGQNMHHAGTVGPGPNMHHAGTIGPEPTSHYAGAMRQGPNMHNSGTMGPGLNIHHAGTMEPEPTRHDAGAMGPRPNIHHAGTMGPGPNMHNAGTMGQMSYQLNEGSMKQMHGRSVGQMYGGSVGQMHGGSVGQMYGGSLGQVHPYSQSEAMHSFGQEHMEEFQDVHEHDDMGYSWSFPEPWQGYSQENARYSTGTSSFPGPSTYKTDRELASGQSDHRMNNPWFQKLVQNMKELVEKEGLIVKDVFPDGNCLFTAVVDQLRVRGNFNFTPSTLRAAAVAFLRENPKQHDGTHLEQFLMNESWDHYLSRMGKDGEWGEHIILGAMSEVLNCRIIVLGGMSGKSSTVVQPQRISDEEEKKMQKKKEAKIVKDESLAGTAKSEVTAAESQSLQTGAASSTSKADAKTKGTDTSHTTDKANSLSKQNKTKKDEELQMGEDLYIGLVGEMHYVSLRKKDWEERLNEKLRARIQKRKAKHRQEAGQIDDSSSDDDLCLPEDELGVFLNDDFSVDRKSGVPVLHLNFLCGEIIKFLLRPDLMPTLGRAVPYQDADYPDWSYEIVGKEELMLERLPIPTLSTHYTDLFSSSKENDAWKFDFNGFIYIMTKDTLLVESEENNLEIDLIIDRSNCHSLGLRLRPVNPSLWGTFVCVDLSGISFLRHVRIDTARLDKTEWLGKQLTDLSFRCLWPREAAEFKRRYRRNSWPRNDILKRIISEGCRVVPRKDKNDDTLWTFSFYAAKKILISQGFSRHQRNCYKLWRLTISGCVKDIYHEHRELFRSIMFFACEIIKSEIWENNPAVCVLYMTERLIIGLQEKFVPDYFIQQVNLVYHLSQHDTSCLTEKLLMIRYNFLALVYFVADKFALSAGELLHTYDKISIDLTMFRKDKDFQRSFSDLVLPVVRKEVKTSVEDRLYSIAEEKILRFYEKALRLNPCLNFSIYFQQYLHKLDIEMQWCLAFCVDKRQGTSFLKDIGKNQKTVPITDLFGPELVKILGRLDVPEICTNGKNIVYFVDRVTDMFSKLYLYEAEIVSLRFFLRKNYIADKAVYVFENDCLPENNGNKSKNEPLRNTETRTIKRILYDMFTRLYDSLYEEEREIEFKDFMLQFENICDRLNTVDAYKYLQELWEYFGDLDKAERAKVKYLSLKSKETDMYGVD
ncbi:hypothetical protein ACJMK2_024802 [Sinanodonta woodiana]|uniref:OTU domain-containing protein n=1 Tax=Sinanodonta woodiana TaxID=1069815 RepID=A0ABD3XEK9_SINWO